MNSADLTNDMLDPLLGKKWDLITNVSPAEKLRDDDYLITQVRFSEVRSYFSSTIKMVTSGLFGRFRDDEHYRSLAAHNMFSQRVSGTFFD